MAEPPFSSHVKDELAHLWSAAECCQRMELAALLRACGRIEIEGAGRLACILATDRAAVARKMFRLIKARFALQTTTMVMRRRTLHKNLTYLLRIPYQPGLTEMFREMGVIDLEGRLQDWGDLEALNSDHCCRAYLRGTFLGTGWIAAPERQHHLEMTTTSTEAADALGQMLFRYGIPVRMAYRRHTHVLYLKEAEQIVRFLNLTGAHEALLHYEDVRALKEMKNLVNRQVNAETANVDRIIDAAARQIEAIKRLQESGRLVLASRSLQELALLRLSHPDASLAELGELCSPRVGKSAVNHRMRQLMQMAGV